MKNTKIAPISAKSLVFIDYAVDELEALVAGALPDTEVVVLHPAEDGIAQITTALAGLTQIANLYLICHGNPASLRLGSSLLTLDSIAHYTTDLQQWRHALAPDANLLLYGCNLAATESGKYLVQQLQQILGLPVAASTRPIGQIAAGQNWHLDFATAPITVTVPFTAEVIATYTGTLQDEEITVLLAEDFSDAIGATPPEGWSIELLEGNSDTDTWRFDNPAGRTEYLDYLDDPVAIYDSDYLSNDDIAEDVTLETPVFDASDSEGVFLTFDQWYGGIAAGENASTIYVEASTDGETWESVYSQNTDLTITTSPILDLTEELAGSETAQVRFRFDGNWSYYWAIDNVEVVDALTPGINSPVAGTVGVSETNVPDPLDFAFSLQSRPESNVTFTFTVDDDQLQPIESITFTPENWNIAQAVTVNAVSDDVDEEEVQTSNVSVTVTSDDPDYNGFEVADIAVEVTESTIPGFNSYRVVEKTYADLSALAAANPNLADWVDIGDSYDKVTEGGAPGYDIYAIELGNQETDDLYDKPVLFLQGSIHAREYTTAEVVTRFAESLVEGYGTDADITWLLDHVDIRIVPYVNPDGRKFAEQGYSWRKNTNPNPGDGQEPAPFPSYGVDLNRNYASQWGLKDDEGNLIGASDDPADLTYQGPAPFSEPESQALRDYLLETFPDQKGEAFTDPAPEDASGVYIDVHSYGNLVLYPFGWTNDPAPNYEGLRNLGLKFGYFTERTDGDAYDVQQAVGLYPTTGTTDDWVYDTFGAAAYTFELGTDFFQNSDYFEETIVPEIIPAFTYAAKSARRPYQTAAGPDTTGVSVTLGIDDATGTATLLATADATRYADGNGNSPDGLTEGLGLPNLQNIGGARYSINTPSWVEGTETVELEAVDGELDSTTERLIATIDVSDLTPGRYTVFVESVDAAGNYGVPTAVFLEIPEATEPTPPSSDTLTGGSAGTLVAATGKDKVLVGSAGKDTFVLDADGKTNIIRRFQVDQDQVGLTGDLKFEQLTLTDRGQSTLVKREDEVLARLKGVDATALSESTFVGI